MKKIMFNDRYGLTDAVLSGRKTMTRRVEKKFYHPLITDISEWQIDNKEKRYITISYSTGLTEDVYPAYQIGEKIAVAQRYWDLRNNDGFYEALHRADPTFPLECIKGEKGFHNKMFVRADWMPHRIRITDIKVERLQDISEADIMCEGIMKGEFMNTRDRYYYDHWGDVANHITFRNPQLAYRSLIDRICGKGTWNLNPWVFVYEFELTKL